jgi:CSLREA domain-containing protein
MLRWIPCALLLLVLPVLASAAPTISDVTPADGSVTHNETFAATVTGGANLVVTVNGVATTNVGDRFTAMDLPLTENADNEVTILAVDDDGTSSVTIHVTYNPPPKIVIDSPADGLMTEFRSVIVSGSVTDADGIDLVLVNGAVATLSDTGEFSERVQLGSGANNVTVGARDKAMNADSKSIRVTWLRVCRNPDFPSDPAGPQPATYTVDRNDDLADPIPDDDVCNVRPDIRPDPDPSDPNVPFVPPFAKCSLRAAIQTANHHPGPDRIVLGNRRIVLTRVGAGEDDAATGDLDVEGELQIIGGARDSALIDGRRLGDRVFDVHDGAKLQLVNLTVSGGRTPRPVTRLVDPNDAERGGCVRSRGELRVNNAAFLGCRADGPGGAIALDDPNATGTASATLTCAIVARSQSRLDGGGIAFDGVPLTVRNSTLSLNSALRRGGAIAGLDASAPGELTLKNVTVSQNRARLAGGALELGDGGHAAINNCTFALNAARAGATVSATGSGVAEISNSILGDTSKVSCDPSSPEPVVSLGGNIDRRASCNLADPTSENVDPKLAPLATNSGPPTHALRVGSPAIDHAGSGSVPCEALDARDVERGDWPPLEEPNSPPTTASPPFCDSGAFELRTPTRP